MQNLNDIENRLRRIAGKPPPPGTAPVWREIILSNAVHAATARQHSWQSRDWLPPSWLAASWVVLGLAALFLRMNMPVSQVNERLARRPGQWPVDGPALLALRAHFQLQSDFYEGR